MAIQKGKSTKKLNDTRKMLTQTGKTTTTMLLQQTRETTTRTVNPFAMWIDTCFSMGLACPCRNVDDFLEMFCSTAGFNPAAATIRAKSKRKRLKKQSVVVHPPWHPKRFSSNCRTWTDGSSTEPKTSVGIG